MLDKLRMEEFSTGFRTRVNEIRHKLQRKNGGSVSKHVAGDSGHSESMDLDRKTQSGTVETANP